MRSPSLDVSLMNSGLATIKSSSSGEEVIGTNDADVDAVKWTVTKKNDDYHIASVPYGTNYAYSNASPASGDPVKTKSFASSVTPYTWRVRETSTPGQYLIYPNDDDTLYWGLTSATGAKVRLTSTSDEKAKWYFEYAN